MELGNQFGREPRGRDFVENLKAATGPGIEQYVVEQAVAVPD